MRRALAVLVTAGVILAGCLGDTESDVFYGDDIDPPVPADDFVLVDVAFLFQQATHRDLLLRRRDVEPVMLGQ